MAEFSSWMSYQRFARSIRAVRRYVREPEAEEFIRNVLATCGGRAGEFPNEHLLWRAQKGCEWTDDDNDPGPHAYSPNRMKPLTGRAREGRVNPKGIPVLYLATTENTAVAEVRPAVGDYVSVAQFLTMRSLKLIDCTKREKRRAYLFGEPQAADREKAVWTEIDHAFSEPTSPGDDDASYAPTQVLAEAFRSAGYEGIVYTSSLGDGHNMALFDLSAARLVNCAPVEVKAVAYRFEEANSRYFVRDSGS